MYVTFSFRPIQLVKSRIRIFFIIRLIEADARINLFRVRRRLCVVLIVQVNGPWCRYFLLNFNGGPVHTAEHKTATRQTLIAPDAPILSWYVLFITCCSLSISFRLYSLLIFEILQVLGFLGEPGSFIFIGLSLVAPAGAEHGETVADGVTAPVGFTHFVVLLAELIEEKEVHYPDQERDSYY